ncbi:DinG family ATP-dependent helicase YoaA [Methylophaga frappieri]|uniref:DNA 5'-3' helicase n=2 Tax=Methylophaga frappieri (strain ATCC BAA-2434 / DSM 25690 / JAM7) TaxID=754477 RepID=I1YE46_METFJ|nr:DinG family ATP-dependent helicase YoaA [Methylophaga frappieri]
MRDELTALFNEDGVLSQQITGFQPRPAQQEMAERVANTLSNGNLLIAEAGTGTGKTFAYLAPAMLSGQKVFISTGTKNLQDQLYQRDLPVLRQTLNVPLMTAILKGRSNYLCHHRLGLAETDDSLLNDQATLSKLRKWAEQSDHGDLSDTQLLDADSHLLPRVTSTVDNCLGTQCPEYQHCFVAEARRRAQEADIVVVNHHLLMSDLALKTAGQGEVLPTADAYIIDEAHQLPGIASQFLGLRLSSHQITELCRDATQEMHAEASDMPSIATASDKLQTVLQRLRVYLGSEVLRRPWFAGEGDETQQNLLDAVAQALTNLAEELEQASPRSQGLSQCHQRAESLLDLLEYFQANAEPSDHVLWLDNRLSGFILNATPFDISGPFQQWLDDKPAAWIFTSATLTVAGQFNHFKQQLGIDDAETVSWESPFDYQQQSLLFLPETKLMPASVNYNQHIADVARQVITLSGGRTFLLFTSYRALYEVAEALKDCGHPLLVQGSGGKAQLIERFREQGDAVLLGTSSFWEGVDVRGDALRCVLIDKIPFASPGDPVLEARINLLKMHGGNPFRSIQIPSAVIQLKQGIGRLIRDVRDYGVLVLCDPRLLNKPYGKVFLRSLPAMPITQNIQDVADFLTEKSVDQATH